MKDHKDIRHMVQSGYARAARQQGNCCVGKETADRAREMGYDDSDLEVIPDSAQLGLGCGNPSAIAELSEGETVLDLGAGAGMDAFLAAERVGESGHVIGVDMTPEMLKRARDTASSTAMSHYVEFRRGVIEDLPVTDDSIDVVMSNCVINLSTDKQKVFEEAYRVLKPGGRLAVSDICLTAELPDTLRELEAGYIACISGALHIEDYRQAIDAAGFTDVDIERTDAASLLDGACADPVVSEALQKLSPDQIESVRRNLWSVQISGRKR